MIGRVFQSGLPVTVPDVTQSSEFADRTGAFSAQEERMMAFIVAPLKADNNVLGVRARHKGANPQSRFKKVHFFAFGGVVKTARWANAVINGRFVLNNQATGFRVEDVN